MCLGDRRKLRESLRREPYDIGPTVRRRCLPHYQLFGSQPVDDPCDITVRHHQMSRQLGHGDAVLVTGECGHDIELGKRDCEFGAQPFTKSSFDRARGAQQPEPQPQPLLAGRTRDGALAGLVGNTHCRPPVTSIACPFTDAADGEHSLITACATSSGLMSRPDGLSWASMARASSEERPVLAEIFSAAVSRSAVSV